MNKFFTLLMCGWASSFAYGQWTSAPTTNKISRKDISVKKTYALDINQMKAQLSKTSVERKNAKAVEILLPDTSGKMHRFAVYSRPVAEKSLAERYDLGSYVGIGIDDPSLYARFSLSGNDFQSMMIKNGEYQFIEPINNEKKLYAVFPKTKKTSKGKAFECHTSEPIKEQQQLKQIYKQAEQNLNLAPITHSSDRKFRTYRLALAVTGEYTQTFGGVQGALTQMNATMTRVNGIYEKDLAVNLILQDFPQLIYEDPNTDPFSSVDQYGDAPEEWSMELQKTLTAIVGEDNYDIGHLFGASGGGGNAGCIGCVCESPELNNSGVPTDVGKGSAYTSPASGLPQGDTFDVDYVAHEFGHQLGAWHTFSHLLHAGSIAHTEPGSGSTIMGYAGLTNANVQMNSDPYFHIVSINQMQEVIENASCGTSTNITNTPPVIETLQNYTIPKGTAFVLTAKATDAENDPLTYTWEQVDRATSVITSTTGLNRNGPLFRSLPPSNSPTRYFPKLSSVLDGNLTIPSDWESVPLVAREMNFTVTVRDNHANTQEQQTQKATQKITVADTEPFKLTLEEVYYNNDTALLTWQVSGTNVAPFNAENVKIDYTTDNGNTWHTLLDSTPNDGSEEVDFSAIPSGTNIIVRVSAIGNVFYAVGKTQIKTLKDCDAGKLSELQITETSPSSAVVSWDSVRDAQYILKYKKKSASLWTEVVLDTHSHTIKYLAENTEYEVQVAMVCGNSVGVFSDIIEFTTTTLNYCAITSKDSEYEYISEVKITPENGETVISSSGSTTYTDYTNDNSRLISLKAGTTQNSISVEKKWKRTKFDEAIKVWIDFNRNGIFEDNELILNDGKNKNTPITATFSVPADAYGLVRMRVILSDSDISSACTDINYGEIEDYAVNISNPLNVSEIEKNSVKIYPVPTSNILNISSVSDRSTYTIYSISGQMIKSGKPTKGQVSVSALPRGTYIITINDNGVMHTHKFIKN